jgi:glycosyltransferase involved in cell wall biosynthesis
MKESNFSRITNKITGFTVLCPPQKSECKIDETRAQFNCPKVTFIIPTVGRYTLHNAIECLLNQTCSEWKAIVIFDGMPPNICISDDRITILQCEKRHDRTHYNSAGYVRNYGIQFATTEWVAFLDDDDGIKPTYVETFLKEISKYDNEVIIFRMVTIKTKQISISDAKKMGFKNADKLSDSEIRKFNIRRVVPGYDTDNFYCSQVGISFAAKKSLFESGIVFETNDT